MIGILIEIMIGWFVLEKMPAIVGASGLLSTVIKIIGVVVLIGGFVSLIRYFIAF